MDPESCEDWSSIGSKISKIELVADTLWDTLKILVCLHKNEQCSERMIQERYELVVMQDDDVNQPAEYYFVCPERRRVFWVNSMDLSKVIEGAFRFVPTDSYLGLLACFGLARVPLTNSVSRRFRA